ncbi:MAG: dihydroorotate dehydrogenase [Candidatus Bathyarchaeales archaeon]
MKSNLSVELAELRLANPTMLAAGILGMTSFSLKRVAEAGAGAVVTKSVGLKPRTGYPNPTVTQVECGVLNAMGLPNPGIDYFAEEIRKTKSTINCPVIASIYGFSAEEYAKIGKKAEKAGADALELNVSCPHVEKVGCEIGQDPKILKTIVKTVKKNVTKPVFVKLTPNVTNIVEFAKASEEGGADAVTAINTLRAMAINAETKRPILGNKIGGLSGPAVKPIALRCVYEIYSEVKVPIIGCGGIRSWRDAVEFILAGATAVQVGTAIAFVGPEVFQSIKKGIEVYLKKEKHGSVREIVGLAHRC